MPGVCGERRRFDRAALALSVFVVGVLLVFACPHQRRRKRAKVTPIFGDLALNLPAAIELYDALIINVENATAHGQQFSDTNRDPFLAEINPVYKLRVLEALLGVRASGFKIDEVKLWVPRW